MQYINKNFEFHADTFYQKHIMSRQFNQKLFISLIKLLGTMTEIEDMIEVVTEGAETEMAAEDLTDMNPQEKEEVTIEVTFKLTGDCFYHNLN